MSLVKSLTLSPARLAAKRRVAPVRERSDADRSWDADGAAYAVYGVGGTNPRCPLESTDRNPVSSLFPFQCRLSRHRLRRLAKDAATRVLRFVDQLLLFTRCTNEPTMLHEINRLAKRMSRYSRFKEVPGGIPRLRENAASAHTGSPGVLRAGPGARPLLRPRPDPADLVLDIPRDSADDAQVSNLFTRPELASLFHRRRGPRVQ